MALCFIISQVMISSADDPIRFSSSALDAKQTHPVKLNIQIYKADRLAIGESYVSGKQVVDSHSVHMADLEFAFHLKSGFKVDNEKAKATVSGMLVSDGKLLGLEVDLAVPALEEVKVKSKLTAKFDQELLQEFSSSSEEGIVYVIVMKAEKLDWSREDKAIKEKRMEEMKEAMLRDGGERKPMPENLSPKIGNVSKEERAFYVKKLNEVREVKYVLSNPRLSDICNDCVSLVKSDDGATTPILDLSKFFGCLEKSLEQPNQPKQWVQYHMDTQILSGKVDGYVDAELRRFVHYCTRLEPTLMRFTVEFVMVDMKETETMENIKRLEKLGKVTRMQRVSQFSIESLTGDYYQTISLGNDVLKVNCGGLRNGLVEVEALFKSAEKVRIESNGIYPIGENLVVRSGLNFGENNRKKTLLVFRIDRLDDGDRFKKVIPQSDPYLQCTELDPIAVPDERNDLLRENEVGEYKRFKLVNDFLNLILSSALKGPLYVVVTTPDHQAFEPSDVVFDIRKLVIWEGVHLNDEDVVLFNKSKAELIYRVNRGAELQLKELINDVKRRSVPRCFKNKVHFYEVDNRRRHDEPWNTVMLLQSNPVSMGSAGLAGAGQVSDDKMKLGFDVIRGREPDTWEYKLDVDLVYDGEDVLESFKSDLVSGKPMILEVKRGEKR